MASKAVPLVGAAGICWVALTNCVEAAVSCSMICGSASHLSNPSCEAESKDCISEYTLRDDRWFTSLDFDVAGRTTWCSDSRQDFNECEERVENVGDGRAPKGDEGCAGSIMYMLCGAIIELCTSDMTESRGPDISTVNALGVELHHNGELNRADCVRQVRIQATIWPVRRSSHLVSGSADELFDSSDLVTMMVTRDTIKAATEVEMQ